MKFTSSNINRFLMFKVPAAFLCGVRMKEIDDTNARVGVTFKWINKNPFKSMYFAVQSMAAELTTGALLLKKLSEKEEKISMLVTGHSGKFHKKAIGKIVFECNNGSSIDDVLNEAIRTGEGQTIVLKSKGTDAQGDLVATYEFEWSIKLKKTI